MWDVQRRTLLSTIGFQTDKSRVREVQFLSNDMLAVRLVEDVFLCNIQEQWADVLFPVGVNQLVFDKLNHNVMSCDADGCRRVHDYKTGAVMKTMRSDYPVTEDVRLQGFDQSLYLFMVPKLLSRTDFYNDKNYNFDPDCYYLIHNPQFDFYRWQADDENMQGIIENIIFQIIFNQMDPSQIRFKSRFRITSYRVVRSGEGLILCVGTANGKCFKLPFSKYDLSVPDDPKFEVFDIRKFKQSEANPAKPQPAAKKNDFKMASQNTLSYNGNLYRTEDVTLNSFKGSNNTEIQSGSLRKQSRPISQNAPLESYLMDTTFDQGFKARICEIIKQANIQNQIDRQVDIQNMVNDFAHFAEDALDVIVVSKFLHLLNVKSTQFYIFVKGALDARFQNCTKLDISLNPDALADQRLRIRRMAAVSPRSQRVAFYLVGPGGVYLFDVDKGQANRVTLGAQLVKNVNPDLVCFSERQKLFFICMNKTIEIWEHELSHMVFNITLESNVSLMCLNDSPGKNLLMVYDNHSYYEIDILGFRVVFREKITTHSKGLVLPVNIDHIPLDAVLQTNAFNEDVIGVSFILKYEPFNLLRFPSNSLYRCLVDQNYSTHIWRFAEYYFTQLARFDFVDDIFGPLSPLVFAIYQNDIHLLEDLLGTHRYPKQVIGYWSPLSFAFTRKAFSAVKLICDHLLRADYRVRLSQVDFCFLLKSHYSQCDSLLMGIPKAVTDRGFPSHLYIDRETRVLQSKHMSQLMQTIRTQELAVENRKRASPRLESKDKFIKKEVECFHIDFEYSFDFCTLDSLDFLHAFAQSRSDVFTSSLWKEVVNHKWNVIGYFSLVYALLYFGFMAVITLSMIFFPDNQALKRIYFIYNVLFIIYEIVEIVAFSTFKCKE